MQPRIHVDIPGETSVSDAGFLAGALYAKSLRLKM
jgi:hypothetical protein